MVKLIHYSIIFFSPPKGEFINSWRLFLPVGCASSSTKRSVYFTRLPVLTFSFLNNSVCVCICHVHLSGLSDSKICPALDHAALVHVNSMLETIPVRTEVDQYIGIDYSLSSDPVVTSRSLDINFRVRVFTILTGFYEDFSDIHWLLSLQGMFFELLDQNDTLMNQAVEPVISEYDRMVYLALSEFFFDSGMFSYYKAGIFQTDIVNEKVTTQRFLKINQTRVDSQTVNNRATYIHTPHSPSLYLWYVYRCPKTCRCCWKQLTLEPSWCWWEQTQTT